MARPLLPILVLAAVAVRAPGQPPKPAPPTKPTTAAVDVARVTLCGPVTVGAVPPPPPVFDPSLPPPSPVVYTKWGLTLLALAGTDAEKTALVVQVPPGVSAEFQRKYVAANGWLDLGKSPVYALTGRLTTEDEVGLFPAGAAPILTEVPAFELGEKRRLVLVAEAVVEITKSNRDKYPAEGTVAVEGRPADAKADLKLTEAAALGIRNGSVPVVVIGRPTEKAAQVRAAGTMVTADGRTELRDATVRIVRR